MRTRSPEQKAREEGLSFTGIYSSDSEEVTKSIKEAREEFPGIRIKKVKANCGGWSGFADKVYTAYKTVIRAKKLMYYHEDRLKELKEEYEKKVATENAHYTELLKKYTDSKGYILDNVPASKKSQAQKVIEYTN